MSTILDVLRRAQEDARSRTQRERIDPGDLHGIVLEGTRPRRRFRAWMLAPIALVLLAGAAGGLFLTEGARAPRARRAEGGDEAVGPIAKPAASNPAPAPATMPKEALPSAPAAAQVAASAAAPVAAASAVAPVAAAPQVAPIPAASPATVPAPAPPAQVAAAAPVPKVAATRAPIGRAAEARNALADAPVGVPRPPDYLEKRVGPDGKAKTWLRRMEPGELARGERRPPAPAAPGEEARKRPLVRHAEDLPPETAAPGEESGARAADGSDDAGAAAPDDGDFAPERRLPVPQVRRLPDGLPAVEVNIVQWSPSAERRFAFVRVDGSTMVKVREGDEVGGLRVVRIHPEGVELAQDDARWILRTD